MPTTTIPNVLVTTEWVSWHATDAGVRVVEVDVDTTAYEQGHVPGAVAWNWTTELCDTLVRDIVPKEKLEALLGRSGVGNETTIVLYGDNNNWFAAWAFWQLKIYGHQDVRIMNGGRKKWLAESRQRETTIVLSGDNNNWFAAWAFWQLKIYGHQDVRIMNGGRKKWLAESRELETDKPSFKATTYKAKGPDFSLRAYLPEVQKAI